MVASKRMPESTETIARAALVVAGLGGFAGLHAEEPARPAWPARPAGALEISVVYAPEEKAYLPAVINDFNTAYAQGRNPMTGLRLADGEPRVWVVGRDESSGKVVNGLYNALRVRGTAYQERPTIFSPSVRHWLALVNHQTGQPIFDVDGSPATAIAPVVIAIWESRLKAIQARYPGREIGWQELLALFKHPDGWFAFGLRDRRAVYYGHTDPMVSSTALSTLLSTFYAGVWYIKDQRAGQLRMEQVRDGKVQGFVQDIESRIKHYADRNTEFKYYIAKGPEYLDLVALEENDLIFINQGKAGFMPPEKLVALYPREGTFLHDHPFAVPNAPWVTDQQRSAAKVFTDFVRTATVQARVMENGFRPVNTAVKLAEPISAAFGVDPNQPRTFLSVPDPGVLNEVQLSWKVVKKQSDITFLIDTSASMADDDKLDHAKKALLRVVAELPAETNVSLAEFNDAVVELVPLGNVGRNRKELLRKITALESNNATSLYDSVFSSVEALHGRGDDSRMRAVVLLSDGADTASLHKIKDVLDQLKRIREVANSPVMIVPIAYGNDADLKELESIANASGRSVVQGDPKNIADLLLTLSKGF